MTAAMAAESFFTRKRPRPGAAERDRRLFNAVAGLTQFTANDVEAEAGMHHSGGRANRLLRTLRDEGHIVRVPQGRAVPHVYRWVDEEAQQ